jgi:hypothetical protein
VDATRKYSAAGVGRICGDDGYPTALVDINYAIRWLKALAAQLNTRADLIGLSGASGSSRDARRDASAMRACAASRCRGR